jgi:hypothetical protein
MLGQWAFDQLTFANSLPAASVLGSRSADSGAMPPMPAQLANRADAAVARKNRLAFEESVNKVIISMHYWIIH